MRIGRRRRSRLGRIASLAGAVVVSAVLLWVLAAGFGTIPPLGAVLDAGRGAWTSAAGGQPATSQTLRVPGLQHPVSVSYTRQGLASLQASSRHDVFLALGYVHASFRLAEMDEERRLGEGRLAQLAGPSELSSDEFELRLGLLRTAQREWAQTPRSSPAGQALVAYAQGVNDNIAHVRAAGTWPAAFSLARVYPQPWTPVDSLVIQGVLTQELDFTTTPLDYALLEKSLGRARTMAWFPVIPANQQNPYDSGPYTHPALSPLAPDAASTAPGPVRPALSTSAAAAPRATETPPAANAPHTISAASAPSAGSSPTDVRYISSPAVTGAAASLLAQISRLPAGLVHREPDSNAWAVNGPKVAGHGAMLAGDPHLPQTLPSVWYEAALSAPGLDASGVTVPGVPGVLIGHNAHIAWSLTDTQNQAALFYAEQTGKTRPGQYYWRGAWRRTQQVRYAINVRGSSPVHLTVDITVHGPIMTQAGQTMAVDWMGNVPSADLTALLGVDEASNFGQFRAALANWHAPTQNFVYADDQGHIGAISAGYYPQVAHGDPWLPLPGTGADDVTGVIPYAAEPQVYDPPGHVVATANQRPAGPSYPYYIGTSADFFDNGFRANEIYAYLRGHAAMTPASFADLQGNVTDSLAAATVPKLLAALRAAPGPLTGPERTAMNLLAGWNDTMTTGSAAASVWWTFWGDYISVTFQPWWTSARVPVGKDHAALALSSWPTSLTEDLAAWTAGPATAGAFTLPSGTHRTAAQVMRTAFGVAVGHLTAKLGGTPDGWTWARLHTRYFPSVSRAAGLGYGPRASSGDAWTVDAAEGGLQSSIGPSWRMIVNFSVPAGQAVTAEGVYPGGQSENPASPWYANLIADWWDNRYLPMASPGGASGAGAVRWSLRPASAGTVAAGAGAGAAAAGRAGGRG